MNSIKLYLSISLLLICSMACRKENIQTEIEMTPPVPAVYIESEILGLVTDQFGNPIEDAEVKWGTAHVLSDQNGYFKLKSIVPNRVAVLNIKKENYFEANQTLSAIKESTIQTKVQLIERTLTASIMASSGGTVAVDGGGKVDFAPNSFKDESGALYTGEVNVYTTYLDPTIPDLNQVMPGNLSALNANDEIQLLKSFGMINVELEGSAGQKLQINQAATLTTPIPNTLLGEAPGSIPLWHFDVESGLWKEEGEATLQGNEYIGEVSHFSWWNCDDNIEVVFLEGHVSNVDIPANVDIRITRPNGDFITTTTSDDGIFSGYVPKDEVLQLELVDECGNIVFDESIGPFTTDYQTLNIIVNLTGVELITLSGSATNCDGLPVSNGYALVNGLGSDLALLIPVENDGTFTTSFYKCGTEDLSLVVADIDGEMQNTPAVFTVQTDMNVGSINTCDLDISSIHMTINGVEEAFYTPCLTTMTQNGQGNPVYNISWQSVFDSGSVSYILNITDENNNPNDPQFAYVYGATPTDTPEVIYASLTILASQDIVKLSSNENLGDLVHFVFNDALITKRVIDPLSGNVIESILQDCTLEIKATLVQ